MQFNDLAGRRFGRLVALKHERRYPGPNGLFYETKCDCGKIVYVRSANLKTGNTKSCGCFRVDACKTRERKKNHPTHGKVLTYYRRNCKLRNLEWNLTLRQFTNLISDECYYCGAIPKDRRFAGKVIRYNGIDRINNSYGYIRDNCVTCCKRCNQAKNDMTVREFILWARSVASRTERLVPHV